MGLQPNGELEDLLARVDDEALRDELRRAWQRRVPAQVELRSLRVPTPIQPSSLSLEGYFERGRLLPYPQDEGWFFRARVVSFDGGGTWSETRLDPLELRWLLRDQENDRAWSVIRYAMENTVVDCVRRALAGVTASISSQSRIRLLWHGREEPKTFAPGEVPVERVPSILVGASRPDL